MSAFVPSVEVKGLVAGPTGPAAKANRDAIQRAIDGATGQRQFRPGPGQVKIPAGDWWVDRPIFLDGNVSLKGEGKSVSRLFGLRGHDLLVAGVSRQPNTGRGPVALTPDHFVDLHTAGPGGTPALVGATSGPRQRWGYRTKGDCHLAQQGGALDSGHRAGITALTVELAIDLSRMRTPDYARNQMASIVGMSEGPNPSPWMLWIQNDLWQFEFRANGGQAVLLRLGMVGPNPGIVRLAIQVDLANRVSMAWVDGQRVPTPTRPEEYGDGTLAANQHCPFGIGSLGLSANHLSDYYGGASDLTFLGLRVSRKLLYADQATLARADGLPLEDGRYFRQEAGVIGLLPMLDPPEVACLDRVVSIWPGNGPDTTAYFLDNAGHGSDWAATSPGVISGLTLVTSGGFGRGLTTGFTLGLNVRDCEIIGGQQGIGSINFGANYPLTILDCDLGGADSPLYLFSASRVLVDRINLVTSFRSGIRMVRCMGRVSNLFAPAWGSSDCYMKLDGSSLLMEDCYFDNEGDGVPAGVAAVYVSPGREFPTIVDVSRCWFSEYSRSSPLALLDDPNPTEALECRFAVRECPDLIRNTRQHTVRVHGPRWQVSHDMQNLTVARD